MLRALALASALVVLGASPAHARSFGAEGLTIADVTEALTGQGYVVTNSTDNPRGPAIASTTRAGINFQVWLYDCSGASCASYQFWAGWSGTAPNGAVNTMNRDYRFGRTYLSANNEPYIETDAEARYGSSEQISIYMARFEEASALFRSMLAQ